LLAHFAAKLAKAGLRRVNVSLDSLKPARFRMITQAGRIEDVLAGIAAAKEAGLSPIKLNVVVLRGINDDEVVDLAKKAEEGFLVRFIEYMPIGKLGRAFEGQFVPGAEIKARLEEALGPLIPVRREGPAQVFRITGASGEVGLITALSAPFCSSCDRLRLTADGKLRLCLLSPVEIDVSGPLRAGATDEELRKLLILAAERKTTTKRIQGVVPGREMVEIGG
ncbi:MAG: GTP 3',8-cyclase MoaA, partial [Candidatus Bipolaricaulaceae bacterium]